MKFASFCFDKREKKTGYLNQSPESTNHTQFLKTVLKLQYIPLYKGICVSVAYV